MTTHCEIRVIKEGTENEDEPTYETRKCLLRHFGLKADIIYGENGKGTTVNYSVCIVEDCITGQLSCIVPENVRITGREIR